MGEDSKGVGRSHVVACNLIDEEDEGYMAAAAGQALSENPHPRDTIRFKRWRHGWHIKRNEVQKKDDEGYLAAAAGQSLSENPHPRGTIRYAQWREGWHAKRDENRRLVRLNIQL